jgi:hypothetical protein
MSDMEPNAEVEIYRVKVSDYSAENLTSLSKFSQSKRQATGMLPTYTIYIYIYIYIYMCVYVCVCVCVCVYVYVCRCFNKTDRFS